MIFALASQYVQGWHSVIIVKGIEGACPWLWNLRKTFAWSSSLLCGLQPWPMPAWHWHYHRSLLLPGLDNQCSLLGSTDCFARSLLWILFLYTLGTTQRRPRRFVLPSMKVSTWLRTWIFFLGIMMTIGLKTHNSLDWPVFEQEEHLHKSQSQPVNIHLLKLVDSLWHL